MQRAQSENAGCCSPNKSAPPKKSSGARRAKEVVHPDHSAQLTRLNRILGQIDGVKRMIESRRYCPEILVQTRAVVSALRAVEMGILEKHVRHCVSEALASKNTRHTERKVEELISVLARF